MTRKPFPSHDTVGSIPEQVAISPDGKKAYVTNSGFNTVSVIDTTNDAATPLNITVGKSPTGIAITPNGKRIYVANDGNVSVIATTPDNKVTVTITFPPGSSPSGIAITPDGKKAYVTNRGDSAVSVIDIVEGSQSENKIIKTFYLTPRNTGARIS